MLSVLSGALKNMKLKVPKQGTRPTSVMLKRKVFDQYLNWEEFVFIDLCAGTGSMAIEALSRGCKNVVAIEANPKAHAVLKDNVELAHSRINSQAHITCLKLNCITHSSVLRHEFKNKKVILFFDPPYEDHRIYKEFFKSFQWLDIYDSQVWVESDSLKGLSESQIIENNIFEHRKTYTQGSKFIACFTGELK